MGELAWSNISVVLGSYGKPWEGMAVDSQTDELIKHEQVKSEEFGGP